MFIRSDPSSPTKKTGMAVATKSNVLAVLNPGSTGNVVWRREFDQAEGRILQYKTHRDALVSISGPGGSHVRLFEAFTGSLLWERQLHSPSLGRLLEPANLGVDITFWHELSDIDAYVLTNGHTVSRLEGKSGKTVWSWNTDDISTLLTRVVLSSTSIHTVGLIKTDSYALTITTLDRQTGALVSQSQVPSQITRGMRDVFVLNTHDTKAPAVVWFEKHDGTLHSVVLDSNILSPEIASTKTRFAKVHDVQLDNEGLFVAETKDELPYVFGMYSTGLKQEWDFDDSAVSKSETPSLFSGSLDREGNAYIARVFWSLSTGLAHIHTYAAHGSEGKGISTGATFPFNTAEHGVILHCAIDAFMPHSYSIQHRMLLTTSTGAVQLWQLHDLQWTRDEALTDIKVAALVDLPERKIAEEIASSEHRGFLERLIFHIVAAQNLPQYIAQFSKRFATGTYTITPGSSSSLDRDPFGFRKVLVVATGYGTLLGIDTAQGNVVWRKIIGVSSTGPADVIPFKMFVTKSALEGPDPEVVLVAEKKLRGRKTKTSVVFHFAALTGRWVSGGAAGIQVSETEVAEAFILPGQSNTIGIVSADGKVHVYPKSQPTVDAASQLYFTRAIGSELRGFALESDLSTPAIETWKKAFTLPATFPNTAASRLEVIHRSVSPIASYGKVMGDRSTLYKYLNPNVAAILAADCAVRVVDLVSGAIVFDSGALPAPCIPPKVAFVENWLVYAHEVGGNSTDKGTKVVSVELYEGLGKDDKTNSVESSSFSEKSVKLHAIQQSFLFPYPIVALGTTSTKFGISTKGLMLATCKNQIYHLHRRILDPRRPLQKPTAQDQEEMLFQYEPVLPPDTRRIVTHKNQVLGTKHIIGAPTLLESTSCVLAYGLDLFHTRVTPSGTFDLLGAGFNKLQLLLTIVGLSVAIVVVRPLVARKQLHAFEQYIAVYNAADANGWISSVVAIEQHALDAIKRIGEFTPDKPNHDVTISDLRFILEFSRSVSSYTTLASLLLAGGCMRLLAMIKALGKTFPFSYEYGYLCFRTMTIALSCCLIRNNSKLGIVTKYMKEETVKDSSFIETLSTFAAMTVEYAIDHAAGPETETYNCLIGYLQNNSSSRSRILIIPFVEIFWRSYLTIGPEQRRPFQLLSAIVYRDTHAWEESPKHSHLDDSIQIMRTFTNQIWKHDSIFSSPDLSDALNFISHHSIPGCEDQVSELIRATVRELWKSFMNANDDDGEEEEEEKVAVMNNICTTFTGMTRILRPVTQLSVKPRAAKGIIEAVVECGLLDLVGRLLLSMEPSIYQLFPSGADESSECPRRCIKN
ncbi:endoplasmic reticulum membrane protein [Rhizoctonia solani]|uniref:ER membrane protein complex subunit 1 n=2 Tax=Rhizoctonia solani TaxID=456999 RepID=A0A8H8P3B8_9AGAM|nr:endoplasmic reticulum membrane protein [Rhizoctonia solani]QRW23033.1 endoplasmic reticulum membrane protein [Rhizoctonia solani]